MDVPGISRETRELAANCPNKWDYWTSSPCEEVELMCLLPNSIYISMKASWNITLQDLKEDLWDRAVESPLYDLLQESSTYSFQFVNSLAALEEAVDETKRLRDIAPTFGMLVVIKRTIEHPGEKLLNIRISHLIGKGLNEFDSLENSEVKDFRTRMRTLAEESMARRYQYNKFQRLRHQCPLRLADKPQTPKTLEKRLSKNMFSIHTHLSKFEYKSSVPLNRSPKDHVRRVLAKHGESQNMADESPENYVLKVCGREEYLYDDKPFIQFLFIQEKLYMNETPEVSVVHIENISALNVDFPYNTVAMRQRLSSALSRRRREDAAEILQTSWLKHKSSWSIKKNYSCVIHRVGKLNVDPKVEVACQVGIFHGGRSLCELQKTRTAVVSCQKVAEWNQELTFPIKVCNLPRSARLCFGIYEITKSKTKWNRKECIHKLAWANTQIFDYMYQLKTNIEVTFSMWNPVDTQGEDLVLHPLGTVIPSPNKDWTCAELQVGFFSYKCQVPILYPAQDKVKAFFGKEKKATTTVMERLIRDYDKLQDTAENEPGYDLHEQEKNDIWAARDHFKQQAPELLPKVLSCVEWQDRGEVSTVCRMLPQWPDFRRVEPALELLDYEFADASVRSFAVKYLKTISDSELLLYFLQLVQTLKHESYLMCDLAVFLLQRAFNNMTIGHHLFWHLRSEMHTPSVSLRYGLMLEAYCRGSQEHIQILMQQMSCLDKFKWVRKCIEEKREISQARAALREHLQEQHCMDTLSNFVLPLNPSFICKRIKSDMCYVTDSKMRPFILDFENVDPYGRDIRVLVKIGDDLRQDMFTLQMLRIMDNLWKNEGYDFRLSPYNCLAMEYEGGMIEVVEEAETVANILKQNTRFHATSTLQKNGLYRWLCKHTYSAESLNQAVYEFTMSCAGYCVATYILGIADRHPDNIMLKKTGQLFHIDFGHFLGNFKQKLGIARERGPFMLTKDFIYVINKGASDEESVQFNDFKRLCETAFQILRKHGHLIISLFSMMISTGLPELSSEKDLEYLRDTLVLDYTHDKAIEHFRKKFDQACNNQTWNTLHWAMHNIAKNNQ